MPIKSATTTEIVKKCAVCGVETTLQIADLTLGIVVGDQQLADAIRLPVCVCGAQEQLFRTWDSPPEEFEGTAHAEQKKTANALAKKLKELDNVDPGVADAVSAEQEEPAYMGVLDGAVIPTE